MTSTEIIDKLLEMKDKEAISDLRELFQTADLVKFAKHNPLMNENDATDTAAGLLQRAYFNFRWDLFPQG